MTMLSLPLGRLGLAGRWSALIDGQRGHLLEWTPVMLACGIGLFFALPREPQPAEWAALACAAVAFAVLSRRGAVVPAALCLVLVGTGLAGWRTDRVAAPVLEFRYYGAVEGRIVAIDRSASDAVRLTLDRVRLEDTRPARTPDRVRISLHGEQGFLEPRPGQRVMATAHLGPPGGPVEPGGFDFRRHAWFAGIGAVGYTRIPVLEAVPPPGGLSLAVTRVRMAISRGVRDILPGETGAFAAAITTGDRSGMSRATLEDLRASNLAHLLAISGLHMGLLTGVVFTALRAGLALSPAAVLWPTKKVAAVGALAAGAFYLALSGGNVATERAYIQVAVMFVAVLLDRRAITLRSVALAATVLLILRPEALTGPGFQMSFAATTALVAVFSAMRGRRGPRRSVAVAWGISLVASSAIAGFATAPIGAAHFNQMPHLGLLANVLSVPVMGTIVIPAAVVAACLAPVGLAWVGLWAMALPIRWILGVADRISSVEGGISYIAAPAPAALPLIAMGGLILALWQGRGRWTGVAVALVGLVIWTAGSPRPSVLLAESGRLIGVVGPEGRALSKPRGDGFAARVWLENDGDPVPQEVAAVRPGLTQDGPTVTALAGAWRIALLTGRGAGDAFASACRSHDVVVLAVDPPEARGAVRLGGTADGPVLLATPPDAGCVVVDPRVQRRAGSLSMEATPRGLRILSARTLAGTRRWHPGSG